VFLAEGPWAGRGRVESWAFRPSCPEEVSLSVGQGEFVSLIGPSGCGKSTLLRLVADLLQADGGHLTIAGAPPRLARTARKIGMVFQEPALLSWRQVARNVELPLELGGAPGGPGRR